MVISSRVLDGRTILITRARSQTTDTIETIKKHGGKPLLFPVLSVIDPQSWESCDHALRRIGEYDAIAFTSINGVSGFLKRAEFLGIDLTTNGTLTISAVGDATAAMLRKSGIQVSEIPLTYSAADLGRALAGGAIRGKRFLLPQGNIARSDLQDHLVEAGAEVDPVVVYQTVEVTPPGTDALVSLLENGAVDVVTFASPSAVRGFFHATHAEALFRENSVPLIAVIGTTTSEEVRSLGLPVSVLARTATMDGLIESIRDYFLDMQQ